MRHIIQWFFLVFYAFVALPPATAQEANYPSNPIKLIITFAPGSGSDIIARFVGQFVSKSLGQPIIVEAKVGAQGSIGADFVRRAAPDGYTLVLGGNSTHAANPFLIKNLPYDPLRDFSPVSQISVNPLVLVVRADLPIANVKDFIAYAKERPGQLNYGVGNSGGRAAAQLLQSLTGIAAQDVSYPGTQQAMMDLISGRLDFALTDPLVAVPFVKSGKLRMLAVTSSVRLPSIADVPTMAQAGVVGYEYMSWLGVFAPAKTPQAVIDKLNVAFVQALQRPEAKGFFANYGMIVAPSTPQEFAIFNRQQIKLWETLVKQAGLKPL